MTNRDRLAALPGGAELILGLSNKQVDAVIKTLVECGFLHKPKKGRATIELTDAGCAAREEWRLGQETVTE